MKLTKTLAGTAALTLGASGAVLGLGMAPAEASTNSFHLYSQIKKTTLQATSYDSGTVPVTMTVTPSTADPGDDITVAVSSSGLDIFNGPAANADANAEELDAVVSLDGTDYVLRGSQNKQVVTYDDHFLDGTNTPNTLFNKGWVVSSTPGASSSTSTNTQAAPGPPASSVGTVAGTTGIGATVRGSETTAVTLKAPTNPGPYTIVLKAIVANAIAGTSTPALTNDFDNVYNLVNCTASCAANGNWKKFDTNVASSYIDPFSPAVSLTVNGVATAPPAPTNVVGLPGDAQVAVGWEAASGATSYKVTSSPDAKTCTTATLACVVTGLTNGQPYTFTVVASNDVGDSPASSASAAVTPKAPTAPGAPTGVTAVAGNALADVSWKAPASDGGSVITGYTVTSAPGGKTCSTAAGTGGVVSLTCSVEGLTNGTAYTFTVTATNAVGSSPASAASSSVTPKESSDDNGGGGGGANTDPRSKTTTVKAYCDVTNTALGALGSYSWPVTLTVSPGAAAPGSTVSVKVSVDGSPTNSGPSTLDPGAYRMESTIKFNGKNTQLIGPKNKGSVEPETGLIFAKSQWPTVASGVVKLPSTEGDLPITIQDIWYNNVAGTGTAGSLNDLFDNRCNASNSPQKSPKAFTQPTVSVSSDASAPAVTTDPGAEGENSDDSSGVLAATGPRQLIALGLLALAALQVGAIIAVRSQRAAPRRASHRIRH